MQSYILSKVSTLIGVLISETLFLEIRKKSETTTCVNNYFNFLLFLGNFLGNPVLEFIKILFHLEFQAVSQRNIFLDM